MGMLFESLGVLPSADVVQVRPRRSAAPERETPAHASAHHGARIPCWMFTGVRVAAHHGFRRTDACKCPPRRASPAGCSQVSASQLTTGFVGQTGAKTRDIFESARGAVLFIDEAYRLYDPLGRSYMQEAIDEIVTLLTEETYKGKMVVIFAGYQGQMSEMLDKVKKMADSH